VVHISCVFTLDPRDYGCVNSLHLGKKSFHSRDDDDDDDENK